MLSHNIVPTISYGMASMVFASFATYEGFCQAHLERKTTAGPRSPVEKRNIQPFRPKAAVPSGSPAANFNDPHVPGACQYISCKPSMVLLFHPWWHLVPTRSTYSVLSCAFLDHLFGRHGKNLFFDKLALQMIRNSQQLGWCSPRDVSGKPCKLPRAGSQVAWHLMCFMEAQWALSSSLSTLNFAKRTSLRSWQDGHWHDISRATAASFFN